MSANILIATPIHGGIVTTQYMGSVMRLSAALATSGHAAQQYFIDSSLVSRARNAYATAFLSIPGLTHLLFIDSDMGFAPSAVLRMIEFGKPFAGCPAAPTHSQRGVRVMPTSRFRLTVPQAIYDAVCDAVEQDFADAYLWGATLVGQALEPRTLTAYRRMEESRAFRELMKRLGLNLIQPKPWRPDCGKASSFVEFGEIKL